MKQHPVNCFTDTSFINIVNGESSFWPAGGFFIAVLRVEKLTIGLRGGTVSSSLYKFMVQTFL